MQKHARIIERLAHECGSQIELAETIGVSNTRLSKWKTFGVPPRHWPLLLRIAEQFRVPLTLHDLDRGSPLTRKRAA